MGREIRMVPPDWRHPTYGDYVDIGEYHTSQIPRWGNRNTPHPMRDETYRAASERWKQGLAEWEADVDGIRTRESELYGYAEFWDKENPPRRLYYREREWTADEATAFQVYETVTEGTPRSPVFLTRRTLVNWLMKEQGMTEEAAQMFVQQGWVLSGEMREGEDEMRLNYRTIDPGAKAFER